MEEKESHQTAHQQEPIVRLQQRTVARASVRWFYEQGLRCKNLNSALHRQGLMIERIGKRHSIQSVLKFEREAHYTSASQNSINNQTRNSRFGMRRRCVIVVKYA
jgi:predicted secreted Zn-dependent protease